MEIVLEEELDECEIKWIRVMDSIKKGYNLREGGNHGRASDETRKLQSAAQTGALSHHYGKPPTEEVRNKISQTLIDNVIRTGHLGQVLPKYIKYVNWKDRQGYAIISHPKVKKKDFTKKTLTLDQLLDQAVKYLKNLK